jgi:hypothetical protein
VQGGQARGYHTIHLLGKWLGQVPRAQTGFHVSYRHVLVEGRQGGDQCGGGVALQSTISGRSAWMTGSSAARMRAAI